MKRWWNRRKIEWAATSLDRKIELLLILGGMGIAILVLVNNGRQLEQMTTQTLAMQGQLTEMKSGSEDTKAIAESAKAQADNTKALASAALDQVKELKASVLAAQQANKTTREAMILDQRPWVGIQKIQVLNPPTEGQSIKVKVPIMNGGKSPALYVMHYSILKPWIKPADDMSVPLTDDPAISHCFQPKPVWRQGLTGGMIMPGKPDVYLSPESPVMDKEMVNVITKVARANSNSPSMRGIPQSTASAKAEHLTVGLFLVGCVEYFDQFRTPHRTGICYLYDSSGGGRYGDFSACAQGNDAD